MKAIYLLLFAFLTSLPAAAMIRPNKTKKEETLYSGLSQLFTRLIEISAIPTKAESIYCSAMNCWSLKECLLHNPRYIFSNYMLQKNKVKKAKKEEAPFLPMMPPGLRFLIGEYAQECPEQYKIENYCQNPHFINAWSRDLGCRGSLVFNAVNTDVVLKEMRPPSEIFYDITLTAVESDFIKYVLQEEKDVSSVTWEDLSPGNRIRLLIRKTNYFGKGETKDLFFLKKTSTSNKALKAAVFLPRNKKK